MRTLRLAVSAALVGGLLAVAAAPAEAAGLQITQLQSADGGVTAVVSSPGGAVDPDSVRVTLDGTAATTTATAAAEAGIERTAILTIDTSGSMRGAGLDGAKAAAREYLAAVPSDVAVGLVTFADTARTVVQPTTNRGALTAAVNGLTASGETALYDGVTAAVTAAGASGIREVVVLSDGGDTASTASLASTTALVDRSGTTVNAVAFATAESAEPALRSITGAGDGQVITAAAPGEVAAAFAASARSTAGQVVVSAEVPDALAGTSAEVTVTATVGGKQVSDSAVTVLSAAAPTVTGAESSSVESGVLGSTWVLLFALLLVFAGLATVVVYAARAAESRRSTGAALQRQLSAYQVGKSSVTKVRTETEQRTALGTTAVARSAVDLAGRVVTKRNLDGELQRRLEAGAIPLRPGEWLLVHILVALGVTLGLALLTGGAWIGVLVGLVLGFAAPFLYLSRKEKRRRRAFVEQLPDTLQLMASSLSAGHSFPQAVDAVVRNARPPVADEFGRALNQSRVGVPLEDALEEVAVRMRCEDFEWVVMAVRINREVGGNLAEVLTSVGATIRERDYLRRQVQVLSADGRLSTYILTALPVALFLFFLVTNRDYIEPLYTTLLGWMLLAVTGVMIGIGWLWMRRIVRSEV